MPITTTTMLSASLQIVNIANATNRVARFSQTISLSLVSRKFELPDPKSDRSIGPSPFNYE